MVRADAYGWELFKHEWNDIQLLGENVALKRNENRLVKLKDLAKLPMASHNIFQKEFDDVKRRAMVCCGLEWKRGGILTPSLNEWIKPAPQQITQAFFGLLPNFSGLCSPRQAWHTLNTIIRLRIQQTIGCLFNRMERMAQHWTVYKNEF